MNFWFNVRRTVMFKFKINFHFLQNLAFLFILSNQICHTEGFLAGLLKKSKYHVFFFSVILGYYVAWAHMNIFSFLLWPKKSDRYLLIKVLLA